MKENKRTSSEKVKCLTECISMNEKLKKFSKVNKKTVKPLTVSKSTTTRQNIIELQQLKVDIFYSDRRVT